MKKFLSCLLACCLLMSAFAGVAFADGTAPAQEIEKDEYTEYLFTGVYPTAIGNAAVEGKLFYDKGFEITISLGGGIYSATPNWGTWEYLSEKDQFELTDTDNAASFTAEKNADGNYTFELPFKEDVIVLTLTPTGTKALSELHNGPARPEGEGSAAQAEEEKPKTILLETEGWTIHDGSDPTKVSKQDGFFFRFYSDGSIGCYLTMRKAESGSGSWTYSEEEGLKLIIGEEEVELTDEGDAISFVGWIEIIPGTAFPRKFVVEKSRLHDGLTGKVAVEKVQTADLADRYSSMTEEEWAAMWAEADMEEKLKGYEAIERTSPMDEVFAKTIDRQLFVPVEKEQRGSIYKVTYTTYVYDYYRTYETPEAEWVPVKKSAYVYLPAGYSAENQYNIFYLMHGATGDETNWFSMNNDNTYGPVGEGDFIIMLDYMMANGLMEPTIFVSLTTNTDVSGLEAVIRNRYATTNEINSLGEEFRNDIIPTFESLYSTYAEDVTEEALVASRDHRAFGGLSMGAYVTWVTMPKVYDLMSYFAPIANGCSQGDTEQNLADAKVLAETMNEKAEYELGYIFAISGRKDGTYSATFATVDTLLEGWTALKYGENIYGMPIAEATHTPKYFILGVYDAMKVFFK